MRHLERKTAHIIFCLNSAGPLWVGGLRVQNLDFSVALDRIQYGTIRGPSTVALL